MLLKFKIIRLGLNKNFWRYLPKSKNPLLIILMFLLFIFSSLMLASAVASDVDQLPNSISLECRKQSAELQEPNVLKNPVLVGKLNTDGTADGVMVVGDYAYVADYDKGLKVINIKIPTAPILVGSLNIGGIALAVTVVGDYAYVADGKSGLKIIDIKIPTAPVLVGSLKTDGGGAYGVAVVEDYGYIANSDKGLKVVNITTKAAPVLAGKLYIDGSAEGVMVANNYAYVADNLSGLKIVDIKTPSAPDLTGSVNTAGSAYGVTVVENYAYVADREGGLKVVDITTPSAPALIGGLDTSGYAYAVVVVGDYAYVADYDKGLKVINIANKKAPFLYSSLYIGGGARDLTVVDNYAYVADDSDGLKIIRVKDNAPIVSNLYKSATTDKAITFTAKDFVDKYSDADNDKMTKIQITSLPNNGTLKLSKTAVIVDQEIAVENLGDLTFEPESKWHGRSSFNWKGFDGFEYSVDAANVNMLIDTPPVVSDISKSGPRDKTVIFSVADFTDKFTDADGDSLAKVQITSLPTHGGLKLSETVVTVD